MTQAYPLEWPEGWARTPAYKRNSNSPFRTTFDKARRDLWAELEHLGAKGVVISSNLELRNDGQPRADSARRRIVDPGVAVYFMLKGKQVVMARDAYETVHDNLRSICLAISHLRGLERHGGATMMDRAFTGFAALPPPSATQPRARTWREIMEFDASHRPDADGINVRFRALARVRHPDAGGSAEAFAELTRARDQGLREIGA